MNRRAVCVDPGAVHIGIIAARGQVCLDATTISRNEGESAEQFVGRAVAVVYRFRDRIGGEPPADVAVEGLRAGTKLPQYMAGWLDETKEVLDAIVAELPDAVIVSPGGNDKIPDAELPRPLRRRGRHPATFTPSEQPRGARGHQRAAWGVYVRYQEQRRQVLTRPYTAAEARRARNEPAGATSAEASERSDRRHPPPTRATRENPRLATVEAHTPEVVEHDAAVEQHEPEIVEAEWSEVAEDPRSPLQADPLVRLDAGVPLRRRGGVLEVDRVALENRGLPWWHRRLRVGRGTWYERTVVRPVQLAPNLVERRETTFRVIRGRWEPSYGALAGWPAALLVVAGWVVGQVG